MTVSSTLEAGRVVYGWTVAIIDENGKRATCLCACGEPRQLGVDALLSGDCVKGCGCRLTPGPRPGPEAPSFAAEIADAENFSATHRRKARGQL